jgi:ATP-binding protein involved in chromosome partitioning
MVRGLSFCYTDKIDILPTGAVIVSTPQDVSLSDVRKGIAMLRKVSVPVRILLYVATFSLHLYQITGLVLNHAYYLCPTCKLQTPRYLFGTFLSLCLIHILLTHRLF